MTFKPMLASECTDTSKLKFPVYVSHKLDGVRATMQGGTLLSRSLKPIPNKYVQEKFAGVPEGIDGELICGNPRNPEAYRKTVSIVMSEDKIADAVNFHVFDHYGLTHGALEGFEGRFITAGELVDGIPSVIIVDHDVAENEEDLLAFEAAALADGHEGVMIRSINGPYKQGRSTEKEGYLLKLKRFCDSEAEVIGFEEKMHNANEAKTNELGRTERSSHKANLICTGVLGALKVRGIEGRYKDVEFAIGTGFIDKERESLWAIRKSLAGKIVKFKFFPSGSDSRPRFPTFLGWRSKIEL